MKPDGVAECVFGTGEALKQVVFRRSPAHLLQVLDTFPELVFIGKPQKNGPLFFQKLKHVDKRKPWTSEM